MRAFLLLFLFMFSCTPGSPLQDAKVRGDNIVIDVLRLPENVPFFQRYDSSGTNIEFFVLKTGGAVRAYINRCGKCFNTGLGFVFEESRLRCRACNIKFAPGEIAHGIGSCYPIPVTGGLDKDTFTIKVSDLLYSYQNRKPKIQDLPAD